MPEIIYSHTYKAWIKECTKCDICFKVQAKDITEAEQQILCYFSQSSNGRGANGLRSYCKSCSCDMSNNRVVGEHRDERLKAQDNRCGICKCEISFENKTARTDHCHISGRVRLVICTTCNVWMGGVDNDDWLAKAIAYRDKFR